MSTELEKHYEPQAVERATLELWDKHEAFRARPDDRGRDRRFVVMIPLPNVTGQLHLGHAINNTLQDIMTRWHRMRGFNSLYQPGTDHAGIATQAVVERRILADENLSRHDLGRDELVRRIWLWKDQYEARILEQLKMMGCSCDWQRVRFTLDDRYSRSVHETFFRWFADGLVYRGKRLVNWDTHLQTAVADDEVYHKTVSGHFWHFKYPIKDPPPGCATHLSFATTRPETMLGDVALAVNPADERYQALVGHTALVPLFDPPREIPVIADEWADPEKGTGCVKITPAHDANDYEVGLRHGLPQLNVMTPDGAVNEHGGPYEGVSFRDARTRVVDAMEQIGLLEKVEDLDVDLPHSDRSKTPIEPYLSDQWFVKMDDIAGGIRAADGSTLPGLAQSAIDAVRDGRVQIFPDRYAKTYLDWLGEKRDWCISRQLWWGHRIPVWTYEGPPGECHLTEAFLTELADNPDVLLRFYRCAEPLEQVSKHQFTAAMRQATEQQYQLNVALRYEEPTLIQAIESAGLRQDPDVLDTWFSSQLWPFATLDWPEHTPDVDYYYPGTVLITSRDIITLWVARMVLSGLYCLGEVPFKHAYIHPKILDGRGETMSKSKGNGVDPLDIIHTHGADALRYTMADMCTETQDIRMPVEYVCPHCGALVDQADAIKAETQSRKSHGEKLERGLQPSDISTVTCTQCTGSFATQWAAPTLKDELGVGRETSDKFDVGRNFCNKLWNAARFAFMNIEGVDCVELDLASLPTEDRWILARLSETIRQLHEQLSQYRFSAAIKLLRDFFWDSLCDWYIELTKARMRDGEQGAEAKQVLAFCLDQMLRLLHPFTPFITERLWEQLRTVVPRRGLSGLAEARADGLLMVADFPPAEGWPALDDEAIVQAFETLQSATRAVRDLRQKNNVPPKQGATVSMRVPGAQVAVIREQASVVQRLANVDELIVSADAERPANAGTVVVGDLQVYVHGISDDAAERKRLAKEIDETQKQINGKEKKLANQKFVQNAKPEVVAAERERLEALQSRIASLRQNLELLGK